jgi:hypothetical protein
MLLSSAPYTHTAACYCYLLLLVFLQVDNRDARTHTCIHEASVKHCAATLGSTCHSQLIGDAVLLLLLLLLPIPLVSCVAALLLVLLLAVDSQPQANSALMIFMHLQHMISKHTAL